MLQFSGFYFGFFFPFTEKLRKSRPQVCNRGGSGVKGGAMGVKPTEFILILSAVEGFRVPVGPLVLLTVYAITRF